MRVPAHGMNTYFSRFDLVHLRYSSRDFMCRSLVIVIVTRDFVLFPFVRTLRSPATPAAVNIPSNAFHFMLAHTVYNAQSKH